MVIAMVPKKVFIVFDLQNNYGWTMTAESRKAAIIAVMERKIYEHPSLNEDELREQMCELLNGSDGKRAALLDAYGYAIGSFDGILEGE